MSYILEALRKAEADRRRGAVPDLHAQVLPAGAAAAEPVPARSALPLWLGGAALLAGAAAAGWLWMGRQETPARVVAEPPAPPPKVAMPPPVEVPPAAQAAPSAPAAVAAASPAKAPPPVRKAQPAAKRDAPAASKAPKRATPAAQPDTAPPPAEPARVPALAELPGDLRQQVPALAIGGSVYSPQASARMVVVNGQVFQEGSALTPELKLEQIRPKSAVFSIRGTRFEVPL